MDHKLDIEMRLGPGKTPDGQILWNPNQRFGDPLVVRLESTVTTRNPKPLDMRPEYNNTAQFTQGGFSQAMGGGVGHAQYSGTGEVGPTPSQAAPIAGMSNAERREQQKKELE